MTNLLQFLFCFLVLLACHNQCYNNNRYNKTPHCPGCNWWSNDIHMNRVLGACWCWSYDNHMTRGHGVCWWWGPNRSGGRNFTNIKRNPFITVHRYPKKLNLDQKQIWLQQSSFVNMSHWIVTIIMAKTFIANLSGSEGIYIVPTIWRHKLDDVSSTRNNTYLPNYLSISWIDEKDLHINRIGEKKTPHSMPVPRSFQHNHSTKVTFSYWTATLIKLPGME